MTHIDGINIVAISINAIHYDKPLCSPRPSRVARVFLQLPIVASASGVQTLQVTTSLHCSRLTEESQHHIGFVEF